MVIETPPHRSAVRIVNVMGKFPFNTNIRCIGMYRCVLSPSYSKYKQQHTIVVLSIERVRYDATVQRMLSFPIVTFDYVSIGCVIFTLLWQIDRKVNFHYVINRISLSLRLLRAVVIVNSCLLFGNDESFNWTRSWEYVWKMMNRLSAMSRSMMKINIASLSEFTFNVM